MTIVTYIFWFSFLLLFYIYAGYPLLMALRARLFPRPVKSGDFCGRCTVVIAAYNEANRLEAKIRSLLDQTASDRIDAILIGSDGSTDATADVVRAFSDSRIKVVSFLERRGKPSVLNDLMRDVTSEITVLTDARQRLDVRAIEYLLTSFSDPSIGVVSGELIFEDEHQTSTTAKGMGAYWHYEKMIRKNESAGGSVPGATGALYAVRTKFVQPIPQETLLDDVAIPMMAMGGNFRCIFEERALVYDIPSQDIAKESIRKRRTIAGVAQLVQLYPSWICPGGHPLWFEFLSHKVLRLTSPIALVALIISNAFLLDGYIYIILMTGQICMYAAALTGWISERFGFKNRWLGIPMMFVALNMYILQALHDVWRGTYSVAWKK